MHCLIRNFTVLTSGRVTSASYGLKFLETWVQDFEFFSEHAFLSVGRDHAISQKRVRGILPKVQMIRCFRINSESEQMGRPDSWKLMKTFFLISTQRAWSG